MFIIRFFLFVVFLDTIIDILEIIFQVINANRYNFPVKPLLLQLLDSGVVVVLLRYLLSTIYERSYLQNGKWNLVICKSTVNLEFSGGR